MLELNVSQIIYYYYYENTALDNTLAKQLKHSCILKAQGLKRYSDVKTVNQVN